jgi:hypothetical protein
MRRSDSEDAEDRNSAADELAQARIAAAPSTARITAGCRNGRNGARVHGGSRTIPPPERGRGGRVRGGAWVRGGSPTVPTAPGRAVSRVVRTEVTVGGGTDETGASVIGS